MKYILHNYRRCPFCIRTRILMHLKDIPYDVVEEPLRKWTTWMIRWRDKTGERARVPILRTIEESGIETVYTESDEINLLLDRSHPPVSYTPEEGSETYAQMRQWFLWCDTILKPQIDLFKYGENLQFDAEKHIVHTAKLRDILFELEKALEGKHYLLEERLTLTDIAIIPFIRQIMRTREGEFDFTDFPRIETWTNSVIETDWFQDEVMKKRPLAPVDGEEK